MSFLEEYKQKLVTTGLITDGVQVHLMHSTKHLQNEQMNLKT